MKDKNLLRIIALLLALIIALTSCGPSEVCTDHVDSTSDGICDICGSQMPDVPPSPPVCTEHVDANDDGKCDNCGAKVEPDVPECTEHVDANGDGKCDNCGAKVEPDVPECTEHVDANGDGKCDNCDAVVEPEASECVHDDQNVDGICDLCGDEVQIIPESPALTYTKPVIPEYSGTLCIEINGGVPSFNKAQLLSGSYEYYAELDALGRCGLTVACIGRDLMPTGDRGSISSVLPTGWQTYQTSSGQTQSFYERSHLIGWQLTGENANKSNLISGTHDLNGEMEKWEGMVAAYVKETGNHVLYRVVPIFEGDELLARGVHMEMYSIEDEGEGISFNIFIYNVEGDYVLNYADGTFRMTDEALARNAKFVVNKRNKKVHCADCSGVTDMKDENKYYSTAESWEELLETWESTGLGGTPTAAGCCHPDET